MPSIRTELGLHALGSGWEPFKKTKKGGTVVNTVTLQQEGRGFNSGPGGLSEFACSPRVCVGSLQVLRVPPTKEAVGIENWMDSFFNI